MESWLIMKSAPINRCGMLFSHCLAKMICFGNFRKTIHRYYLANRMASLLPFYLAASIFWLNILTVEAQAQKSEEDYAFYELGIGDVLEVIVFDEPQISKTVFVRNDGKISLPLVGELMAAGMRPETLSQKIAEKLMKIIEEPKVTVILIENKSKVYYVLGQITTPGQYTITQPVTVLQAIAKAGGFLEWAKKSDITIVRGKQISEKILYFNYDDFLKGNNIEQNVIIKPGDTIIVP
jgi:polysaccharide biosynthesis/export protein